MMLMPLRATQADRVSSSDMTAPLELLTQVVGDQQIRPSVSADDLGAVNHHGGGQLHPDLVPASIRTVVGSGCGL